MLEELLIHILLWNVYDRSVERFNKGKKMLKSDLFRVKMADRVAKMVDKGVT